MRPGAGHGHRDQLPGDAGLRILAGRIDIQHERLVRPAEGGPQLPREDAGPAEQVGLEDGDDPAPVRDVPRGREVSGHLGGMVRVAVQHPHPVGLALELQAAPRPAVGAQPAGHRVRRKAQFQARGQHCCGVEGIVPAGDAQLHPRGELGLLRRWAGTDLEADRHAARQHGTDPVVRVRRLAVGPDPQREFPGRVGQGPGTRVIGAGDQQAARGDAPGKLAERDLDLGQAGVIVQVVGFHAGHDGRLGREHEERAVALVGLGHEQLAAALVRAEAGLGEDAADHVGRVGAAVPQHGGEHGRGGGLAVRAGHRDAPAAEHHRGQRGRPVQHAQAALPGGHQLGVVRPDGGGHDERVRPGDVRGVVPDADVRAEQGQLVEQRRAGRVTAGHADSPGQHDPGDPGHARPADAGEVHPAELPDRDRVHRGYQAHAAPLICCSFTPCACPRQHRPGPRRGLRRRDLPRHGPPRPGRASGSGPGPG